MPVASIIRKQPFKAIYVGSSLLCLVVFRIPWWTLRNLRPGWRPRPTWSIRQCIGLNLQKFLIQLGAAVGGLGHNPTYKELELGKGVNGLWIEPVPDLVVGDVKKWAEVAGVESIRIPGYWLHKPGETIATGETPKEGEKVILSFHGGGYVALSAHPSSSVSQVPRHVMKHTSSARRALSVEYRLAGPGNTNPFPSQLIDALAGYNYLVRTVGFKPENIIIVGDSAGANLALALTRYLITSGESLTPQLGLPGGIVLLSPWVDLTGSHATPGSSVYVNARSDFLSPPPKDGPDFSPTALAGPHGPEMLTNEYISPATKENANVSFKGFPQSFIVCGGAETLVDSIRTLEERMERDLGKEKLTVYIQEDGFHDFIGSTYFEPQRTQAAIAVGKWIDSL